MIKRVQVLLIGHRGHPEVDGAERTDKSKDIRDIENEAQAELKRLTKNYQK